METVRFIAANLPLIGRMTLEHISIVGVAVTIAIATGVPIGILITQNKAAADRVLYVAAIIMTIPSIALFGLLIPVLSLIGQGIGYLPAVIALILYSQLPIALPVIVNGVRNAVVLNIAIAAIATYIGAGGLGTFISRGISQTDIRQLLTGALAVSLLAIVADYALLALQRALTSPGLRDT